MLIASFSSGKGNVYVYYDLIDEFGNKYPEILGDEAEDFQSGWNI